MPTYTVTDPQSGRTLRLTGDSPPTEQELNQIFTSTQPGKSIGGFVGNVAKSGGQFVEDMANTVLHPIETGKNLFNLGSSLVSLVLPGEQGNEYLAKQVGQYYADRYGGIDKAWNSFYNDPVGVAADVSTVLTGAGALVKGVGTAGKVNSLAKAGNAISKVGRATDPLIASSKLMGKVPNPFRKFGTKLKIAGEELPTKGIGNPAKQAELERKYGKSFGQFIDENDLWDRSPESAAAARHRIGSQYDLKAMDSTKKVPTSEIFKKFDDAIAELNGGAGAFSDSNQALIAELQRRKLQLQAHLSNGGELPNEVGINQITDFRRNAIDPDVPKSMFNLDAKGSGTAQGVKKSRDILKATIDSSDPAIAGLGADYGMARGVEDVFRKSASRSNNRQLISLSKLGAGGVGGVVGGIPGAAAMMAVEQVAKSPQFLKTASRTMKKVGSAIENAKMPKVPNYVNTAYKTAKTIRMLNPTEISKNQAPKSPVLGGLKTAKLLPSTKPTPSPTEQSYSSLTQTKVTPITNPFVKSKKLTKGKFY